MTELYRGEGLEIYEKSHYSHGEHIDEVEQILSWYSPANTRILDIGCSAGLHALEFAKRGFSITGIDIEPSAIELAKKRNKDGNLNAEFIVGDIGEFDFSSLGKFDLVYSIGNVLSHVKRDNIRGVLEKIKEGLDVSGILLFNVLIISKPYEEEIKDNDLGIIWKRKIDEKTGHIDLVGFFLDFDYIQHFDVWGYTQEEMKGMLKSLGYRDVRFSGRLDFSASAGNKAKKGLALYFRASG